MWFWTEETQLNINELRYELLLSIESTGYNAWHRAADTRSLQLLDTAWSCVEEAELNTNEFLLAQYGNGYTGFLLAAENIYVETQNRMRDWAEEKQLNPNELKK